MKEKEIYWHRELPPLEAEIIGEHTLEAVSGRVSGALSHGSALWDQCHADLMMRTDARLRQEIARLGGQYAHVTTESIDPRHDEAIGETWLHGRFTYTLYGGQKSDKFQRGV